MLSGQTEFLADDKINSRLNELVSSSKYHIIICNPWLESDIHFMENLISALDKEIDVDIITLIPAEKKYEKTLNSLYEKGAKVYFREYLHAKIFIFDSRDLVVGSANVKKTSLHRNSEAALHTNEREVTNEACEYIDTLKDKSKEMVLQEIIQKKPQKTKVAIQGHCIQCGKLKDFERDKPLCMDCWKKSKHKYRWRKFCHNCGKDADVNVARPLCDECYKT